MRSPLQPQTPLVLNPYYMNGSSVHAIKCPAVLSRHSVAGRLISNRHATTMSALNNQTPTTTPKTPNKNPFMLCSMFFLLFNNAPPCCRYNTPHPYTCPEHNPHSLHGIITPCSIQYLRSVYSCSDSLSALATR